MKVGVSAGYWGPGSPAGTERLLAEAEELGVDSFWTAEARAARPRTAGRHPDRPAGLAIRPG